MLQTIVNKHSVLCAGIDLHDRDELHNFLLAYIFFASVFEGCWFCNGFSPIFSLQRRGLMKGTPVQLQYILRDPVLGYSAEDHIEQFRYVANRRARQLGLDDEPFPGAKNTLTWLDEQANLRKEKNFFETRVTEYQTGGALRWD